tara:strand:+ start:1390 stop:4131 length:2742 start_codon:yes stop_codon:yes gene_type:complete
MVVHGSSRISDLTGIGSLTGPTGPTGAIGAGGTYGRTGDTGIMGFTGYGITAAIGTGGGDNSPTYEIIFTLTGYEGGTYGGVIGAGTTLGVTAVRGGTGVRVSESFHILNTVGINGITSGVGYGELFKNKVGITANFRNLTISGRDIKVNAYNDYMMVIGGVTHGFGRMGNTGELLFINPELGGLSAQGALNTFWSGDQLTARILTHKELFDGVVGSNNNFTEKDNNQAGLPINTSAVVSTSNIDGTAVTFSSIFEDEFHGEGSTAIPSGIHLGGGAAGTYYKFAGVTFDSKYIIADNLIGSCCFCSGGGNVDSIGCVDYISKTYCDAIEGKFSTSVCLDRTSDEECYSGDACCINGICVETSEDRCKTFGGFYINGLKCEEVKQVGDPNTPTGCTEPCGIRGSCCIDNECFELTEIECSFSPNGIWLDKPCSETNCCIEANIGACCVDEICFHTSAGVCATLLSASGTGESTGVFWGIGSKCAGLNLALPNEYSDAAYYPHDCFYDGKIHGRAIGGVCVDEFDEPINDPETGETMVPPCPGCGGWNQVMPGSGLECDTGNQACLCDEINCVCEPDGNPSYTCLDPFSCGTIQLVDGSCWECCRNEPTEDEVEDIIGSCCNTVDGSNYTCELLSETDCSNQNGYWSSKSCDLIECNFGACCHPDGWCEPDTTPSTCTGIWVAGDCGLPGNNPCDIYRAADENDIGLPKIPSGFVPPSGSSRRKVSPPSSSRPEKTEERKIIDRPDAKKECSASTNIPSCVDPGIAIPPTNNDQWIIDVGCGECSCCCPGVCWKGALGEGGIVKSCKDINERCYQTFDCSNNQCVYNPNELYSVDSVPNVLPICTNSEIWKPNKYGCVPYIDTFDSDNPIWMVCSCCCVGGCIEYKEPIACSECENKAKNGQCVCVSGCDDCFS